MKKIKTFEAACKVLGIDPTKLPEVLALPELHRAALIAHYKLIIIAQALNGGWQPNWDDSSEYKYFPYFWVKKDAKKPAGFGLSYLGCGRWDSTTAVGSRLCYKSSEIAEYAGKQFIDLYEQYFLIQ